MPETETKKILGRAVGGRVDCPCHNRPWLMCPAYTPVVHGVPVGDLHVEVKPRAVLFGRATKTLRPLIAMVGSQQVVLK